MDQTRLDITPGGNPGSGRLGQMSRRATQSSFMQLPVPTVPVETHTPFDRASGACCPPGVAISSAFSVCIRMNLVIDAGLAPAMRGMPGSRCRGAQSALAASPAAWPHLAMQISFALFADAANLSQEGKLNILGVFDAVQVGGIPTVHPRAHLVVRLKGNRED